MRTYLYIQFEGLKVTYFYSLKVASAQKSAGSITF